MFYRWYLAGQIILKEVLTMLSAIKRFVVIAAFSIFGAVAASAPAEANASFDFNLTFADGGTATGQVLVALANPNDFVVTFNVLTSGANGFLYKSGLGLPTPVFADGNLYLTFNRTGYLGFFQLVFTVPVSGNGIYALNKAASFECIGGYQSTQITDNTCSHGTKRALNADHQQQVVVPEPASIALFGSALLLFAFMIRRSRKSVSKI
jgi:hypothetical protein